jgi:hypothetical protein
MVDAVCDKVQGGLQGSELVDRVQVGYGSAQSIAAVPDILKASWHMLHTPLKEFFL